MAANAPAGTAGDSDDGCLVVTAVPVLTEAGKNWTSRGSFYPAPVRAEAVVVMRDVGIDTQHNDRNPYRTSKVSN